MSRAPMVPALLRLALLVAGVALVACGESTAPLEVEDAVTLCTGVDTVVLVIDGVPYTVVQRTCP